MKKKLSLLIITILLLQSCFSQTNIEVAFFSIYDTNGVPSYIRLSDVKEFDHPQKTTKIYNYNGNLDIIGYWIGIKRKYVKLKTIK